MTKELFVSLLTQFSFVSDPFLGWLLSNGQVH